MCKVREKQPAIYVPQAKAKEAVPVKTDETVDKPSTSQVNPPQEKAKKVPEPGNIPSSGEVSADVGKLTVAPKVNPNRKEKGNSIGIVDGVTPVADNKSHEPLDANGKEFSSFEGAKGRSKVFKDTLDNLRTGKGLGKKMVEDLKIQEKDLAAFVVSGVDSPEITKLRENLKSQGGWTAQSTITRLTTLRVEYTESKLVEINSKIKSLTGNPSEAAKQELAALTEEKEKLEARLKDDKSTLSSIGDKALKVRMANQSSEAGRLKSKLNEMEKQNPDEAQVVQTPEYKETVAQLEKVFAKSAKDAQNVNDYAAKTKEKNPVASQINLSVARIATSLNDAEAKVRKYSKESVSPSELDDLSRMGFKFERTYSTDPKRPAEMPRLLTNAAPSGDKPGGIGFYLEKAEEFGTPGNPDVLEAQADYGITRGKQMVKILEDTGVKYTKGGNFDFKPGTVATPAQLALMKNYKEENNTVIEKSAYAIGTLTDDLAHHASSPKQYVEIKERIMALHGKRGNAEIEVMGTLQSINGAETKIHNAWQNLEALKSLSDQTQSNVKPQIPSEYDKKFEVYEKLQNELKEEKEHLQAYKDMGIDLNVPPAVGPNGEIIVPPGFEDENDYKMMLEGAKKSAAKVSAWEDALPYVEQQLTAMSDVHRRLNQQGDETDKKANFIPGTIQEAQAVFAQANSQYHPDDYNSPFNEHFTTDKDNRDMATTGMGARFERDIKEQKELDDKVPESIKKTPEYQAYKVSSDLQDATLQGNAATHLATIDAREAAWSARRKPDVQDRAMAKAKAEVAKEYLAQGRTVVPNTAEASHKLTRLNEQFLQEEAEAAGTVAGAAKGEEVGVAAASSFYASQAGRVALRDKIPAEQFQDMSEAQIIQGNELAVNIAAKSPESSVLILRNNAVTAIMDIPEKDKKGNPFREGMKRAVADASLLSAEISTNSHSSVAGNRSDFLAVAKSMAEGKTIRKPDGTFETQMDPQIKAKLEDWDIAVAEDVKAAEELPGALKQEKAHAIGFLKYKTHVADEKSFENAVGFVSLLIRNEIDGGKGEISAEAFDPMNLRANIGRVSQAYDEKIAHAEKFAKGYRASYEQGTDGSFISDQRRSIGGLSADQAKHLDDTVYGYLSAGGPSPNPDKPDFKTRQKMLVENNGGLSTAAVAPEKQADAVINNLANLTITDIIGKDTKDFEAKQGSINKALAFLNRYDTAKEVAQIVAFELITAGIGSAATAMEVTKLLTQALANFPRLEKAIMAAKAIYNIAPNAAKSINIFKDIAESSTLAARMGTIATGAAHMTLVTVSQKFMTQYAQDYFGKDSGMAKAVEYAGQFMFVGAADKFSGLANFASRVAMNTGIMFGQQAAGAITEKIFKECFFEPGHQFTPAELEHINHVVEGVSMTVGILVPSIIGGFSKPHQEAHEMAKEHVAALNSGLSKESPHYKQLEGAFKDYFTTKLDAHSTSSEKAGKLRELRDNVEGLLRDKNASLNPAERETLKKNTDGYIQAETAELAIISMPKANYKSPEEYGLAVKKHLEEYNAQNPGTVKLEPATIEKTARAEAVRKAVSIGVETISPAELSIKGKTPAEAEIQTKALAEKLQKQKAQLTEKLKSAFGDGAGEMAANAQRQALELLIKDGNLDIQSVASVLKAHHEAGGQELSVNVRIDGARGQYTLVAHDDALVLTNAEGKVKRVKLSEVEGSTSFGTLEIKDKVYAGPVNKFLRENIGNEAKMTAFYNKVGWENLQKLAGVIDPKLFDKIHEIRDKMVMRDWEAVKAKLEAKHGVKFEEPYVGTSPTAEGYKKAFSDVDFSTSLSSKLRKKDGTFISVSERVQIGIEAMHMLQAEIAKHTPASGHSLDVNVYTKPEYLEIGRPGEHADLGPADHALVQANNHFQREIDFFQIKLGFEGKHNGGEGWESFKSSVLERAGKNPKAQEQAKEYFRLAEERFDNHKTEVEKIKVELRKDPKNKGDSEAILNEKANNQLRMGTETKMTDFLKKHGNLLDKNSPEGQAARVEFNRLQAEMRALWPEAFLSSSASGYWASGNAENMKEFAAGLNMEGKHQYRISQDQYIMDWTSVIGTGRDLLKQTMKAVKYDLRDIAFRDMQSGVSMVHGETTPNKNYKSPEDLKKLGLPLDHPDSRKIVPKDLLEKAIAETKSYAKTPEDVQKIWKDNFGADWEKQMTSYLVGLHASAEYNVTQNLSRAIDVDLSPDVIQKPRKILKDSSIAEPTKRTPATNGTDTKRSPVNDKRVNREPDKLPEDPPKTDPSPGQKRPDPKPFQPYIPIPPGPDTLVSPGQQKPKPIDHEINGVPTKRSST